MNNHCRFIGVDLFSGAGGMSLGAKMAGIDVKLAIEKNQKAATTYQNNHPEVKVICEDIRNVSRIEIDNEGCQKILFGGPPCQGFSSSNKKTGDLQNSSNWLYQEFIRLAFQWEPNWIIMENVKGIIESNKGLIVNKIIHDLEAIGYKTTYRILCASDFGVPQFRQRFFLIAARKLEGFRFPNPIDRLKVSVGDAIYDLPPLETGANVDYLEYPGGCNSSYSKSMRTATGCRGHLVTKNNQQILSRYSYIPQGGNWMNIPADLMQNYSNRFRCHTIIYHRLKENEPSIVINNYRKSMIIHPNQDRGLSVREAARLQSFPDWYNFEGSIGFQQQQVCDAVPPLLAYAVFKSVLDEGNNAK